MSQWLLGSFPFFLHMLYVSEYRKRDLMAQKSFFGVINTIIFYEIRALQQAIKRVFTNEESEVISV